MEYFLHSIWWCIIVIFDNFILFENGYINLERGIYLGVSLCGLNNIGYFL